MGALDAQCSSARTQRVTANDISAGQVRVPHDTKALLPPARTRVRVNFLGHETSVRWDPRFGPDQERSGVLGIGVRLMRDLVRPGDVLTVDRTDSGVAIRLPDER